ncbi:uncharacterized protein LOC143567954 [Bidens hawaiensis]|uniref:uncharacterized protein LOC143567954 n=1 Tax=Bidens hawaiensis TaxID=980011 RepID=UPI00404AF931
MSKNKIWLDLNLMLKRAKLAGKALQNLLFHHHHTWAAFTVNRPSPHLSFHSPPPGEHEFSCTTSPSTTNNNQFSLFSPKKMKHVHNGNKTMQDIDMKGFDLAVLKAMEMIHSETSSPGLPGFGRSPVVRQLRVTDSPFPVTGVDEDEDYSRVDEEAERFINRFYNDLRRQKQIRGSETVESSPLITRTPAK